MKSFAALRPLLTFIPQRYNSNFDSKHIPTVKNVLHFWRDKFRKIDLPEPYTSIQIILGHVLGLKDTTKLQKRYNDTLSNIQMDKITEMCEKRLKRLPLQYIIEEWDFRNLTLKMAPPVFIPRPETEILVDLVLEEIRCKNVGKVLELCCGSGAIALSLLDECPQLEVTAVDQSKEAINLTAENSKRLRLSERLSLVQCEIGAENWCGKIRGEYGAIVANPPYVPRGDLGCLMPEITRYEDLRALDGGEDGLNLVKVILEGVGGLLVGSGKLFLEVDPSHPVVIKEFVGVRKDLGLRYVGCGLDFSGRQRFVIIQKTSD